MGEEEGRASQNNGVVMRGSVKGSGGGGGKGLAEYWGCDEGEC